MQVDIDRFVVYLELCSLMLVSAARLRGAPANPGTSSKRPNPHGEKCNHRQ